MEKIIKDEFYEEASDINHKMVIKLKIPKPPVIETQGKRVCLICNKEFSSGKALGGHMRIHVHLQSHNKNPNAHSNIQKKKELKKTAYYINNNSVNDEGKPTCSQCGKTFPSMKSLFGHMRCHPERVWRGIVPPPSTPYSTSTATTMDGDRGGGEVVDLRKFIRGWPVTGQRGRKSLKPPADQEDDQGLLEAVEDLMSLANGVVSVAESNSDSVIVKDNKIDCNSPVTDVCVLGKGKTEEMNDDHMITDEQLSVNYKYKIKKRKKMKLMMELQQKTEGSMISIAESKYKCTICNKGFATYQALGGHRSSHNKSKIIEEDDHESLLTNQSSESLLKEFEFEGVLYDPVTGTSGLHQCKVCDKVFASGQALGGHKRCHFGGISEAKAPSSQITSAGEGGSQTERSRKVLDFDLNEIPMAMMEEDEPVSSSYNSNMS